MSSHVIKLEEYESTIDDDDPNANFKRDVAFYTRIDPMPTMEGMNRNLNVPIGAIARYVLVKWATSGSEGVMEIGPRVVKQMADIVKAAEQDGTDKSRLEGYQKLSGIVSWLNAIP